MHLPHRASGAQNPAAAALFELCADWCVGGREVGGVGAGDQQVVVVHASDVDGDWLFQRRVEHEVKNGAVGQAWEGSFAEGGVVAEHDNIVVA